MSDITIDLTGERELLAALDRLSDRELRSRTMRALRAGAKVYRQRVRAEAASARPKQLRKTKTKSSGRDLAVRVSPVSPLANIWEAGGARPHQIGKPGQLLSNRSRAPSERPFTARGPVDHPGFRAHPVWKPAFEAATPEAERLMFEAVTEGIRGNAP